MQPCSRMSHTTLYSGRGIPATTESDTPLPPSKPAISYYPDHGCLPRPFIQAGAPPGVRESVVTVLRGYGSGLRIHTMAMLTYKKILMGFGQAERRVSKGRPEFAGRVNYETTDFRNSAVSGFCGCPITSSGVPIS